MQAIFALGPLGTNGHEAAKIAVESLLPQEEIEISLVSTNLAILDNAKKNQAYGVVPVENSSAGLVDVIRDFWYTGKAGNTLHVIGKIRLPIEHHLLIRKEQDLATVNSVISHPQALAQCSEHLQQFGISNRLPALSTAAAAEEIAYNRAAPNTAAIASRLAAEIYGLSIAKERIEDFSGNVTFFYIVGPNSSTVTGNDQTAIIFRVPNKTGALLRVLNAISIYGESNMNAIHSIPLGTSHEYAFYCEFEGHKDGELGNRILRLIRDVAESVTILGSFPTPAYLR